MLSITHYVQGGSTALMGASICCNLEIVRALLTVGADKEVRDHVSGGSIGSCEREGQCACVDSALEDAVVSSLFVRRVIGRPTIWPSNGE